ncbi:hypothetical protein AUR04nite_17600 [Glutamicibacter uratoxydans]|uniref:HTH marR-type domain-containing protein n=1 Tax=Glutamicibacter uratoxydans TaxID=43667 RepID=A0A4Y4DS90_GLUUR|nr:MarR family transcriptional regulator [Glutamicibacter uratoxydans]GED06228.1 hypothetical protein AUR04nite_17600 [Glutamicibacter uratoxydans]
MVTESITDRPLCSDIFRHLQSLLLSYSLQQHEFGQRLGLNDTDLAAANILRLRRTLSAGELAQMLGVSTAGITTVLDRLEARGYACRSKDPEDRRRTLVEPGPLFPALQGPGTSIYRSLHHFYFCLDEPSRDILHAAIAQMNAVLADRKSSTSPAMQPLEQTS